MRSTTASISDSCVLKWLLTVVGETSARRANSFMVVPCAPRSLNSSSAALRIRSRVCATCADRRSIEYDLGMLTL